MLAMDVVDTLRHQQSLVDHALSADSRDAALTERIRKIYLAQGIEVTDEVIANGVKALREERFAYRAPPGGIKTWLAKCYVSRSRAYKPLAALVAAIGVWWGATFAFSTLPAQRDLESAMTAYNTEVVRLQSESISLKNRLAQATGALPDDLGAIPADFKTLASSVMREAKQTGEQASKIQSALSQQRLLSYQDRDEFGEERESAQAKLSTYASALDNLGTEVAAVEKSERLLESFRQLPVSIKELAQTAKSMAKEPAVAALADTTSENAIAALKSQDLNSAKQAHASLENLIAEVSREYDILVVSRPGEKTGVWRYPEKNRQARNFYIVVEAVTSAGERLQRAILSEEDGKTYRVKRWAMRVDEATYNAIAADKADDGIVQNKRFGKKDRGYINPDYRMRTTGASIVSW